jgi:hypothetical protein
MEIISKYIAILTCYIRQINGIDIRNVYAGLYD